MAGIILLIVGGIYWYCFNDKPISYNTSVWGEFGDYFGGVLNPIFALMAFVGLLWSIYQNQINLYKTSDSFERSMQLAELQEKRQAKQEKKDDLFKIIEVIYIDINKLCDIKLNYSYNMSIMEKITREVSLAILVKTEYTPKECEVLMEQFDKFFGMISSKLFHLMRYLVMFEEISYDTVVTDYYKNYYYHLVIFLEKVEMISGETAKYYRDAVEASGTANIVLPFFKVHGTGHSS
jgi:hypothetical protein